MFTLGSRYYSLPRRTLTTEDGTTIVYVARRFVPPPERFELIEEHTVGEGERHDTIAAAHLGDPEQSWRLCDANNVMQPEELTTPIGRRVRITMPEGIPGARRA
jgi:hypothetical protein